MGNMQKRRMVGNKAKGGAMDGLVRQASGSGPEAAGDLPSTGERRQARGSHAATVAVAVCVAALVLLAVLGSLLTVGDHLAAVSPVLGAVFYAVIAALLVVGVAYPIARVASRPVFSLYRLRDEQGRAKMRWCRRLAANLRANVCQTDEDRAALQACLTAGERTDDMLVAFFNERVVPGIDVETKRAAKTAFFATAVSQSPLVDAVTMLSVNFNLVRAIVERCGFRPPTVSLIRLYLRVMASALVAGGLEEMDLDALLAGVLGSGAGGKVSSALIASAGQGVVNAFFTYRVGVMTKRLLCAEHGPADIARLRRASYGEALSLMKESGFLGEVFQVMRTKAGQVANAAATAAKDAAAQAGRSAAESVVAAATETVRAVKNSPVFRMLSKDRMASEDVST